MQNDSQNNQNKGDQSIQSGAGQNVVSQNIPSLSQNDPPPANLPNEDSPNSNSLPPTNQDSTPSTQPNPFTVSANQDDPIQSGGLQSFSGQAPSDTTEVNVPEGLSKKSASGKFVPTILGIVLLVGAVGAGVYLAQSDTEIREKAQEQICVESNNCIVIENPGESGSYEVEGIIYSVFLTDDQVRAFDHTVTEDGCYQVVIEENSVNWQRVGTSAECNELVNIQIWATEISGAPDTPVSSQCLNLIIYNSNWEQLTQEELNNLQPGDVVKFGVSFSTSEGDITQARFIVNGVPRNPVSDIRADTNEFVDEYTIPADTENIEVDVQLNHSEFGWF